MSTDIYNPLQRFKEQKDFMEDKIFHGIESNRKAFCKINFTDKEGNPIHGAKIDIKQKSHDFKFGANIFKLGCFSKDEDNAKYEESFKKLFNYATVPFYWDTFEPEDGKMRFDKNSVFIDRRPPSDTVVEFCQKNNIAMKGHCLFWSIMLPQWLPNSYSEIKPYIVRRLKAIAEKYDGVMESFDIVNEMTSAPGVTYSEYNPTHLITHRGKCMDGDFTPWVFKQAERFFNLSKFNINEAGVWNVDFKEASKYFLMIDNVLKEGCRVDNIGMQYHLFIPEKNINTLDTVKRLDPINIYRAMDLYGKFGKKLQMSEITVFGYDEDMQAEMVKNLYSIWFSHKSVESITYWNLSEKFSFKIPGWDETIYKGGIIGDNFRRKPAFDILDELINKTWQTNITSETADDYLYFKAFYGKYDVDVICNGKKVSREINFVPDGCQEFYFEI